VETRGKFMEKQLKSVRQEIRSASRNFLNNLSDELYINVTRKFGTLPVYLLFYHREVGGEFWEETDGRFQMDEGIL